MRKDQVTTLYHKNETRNSAITYRGKQRFVQILLYYNTIVLLQAYNRCLTTFCTK